MNIFTYIQTIRKRKARSLRLSRTDNLIHSHHDQKICYSSTSAMFILLIILKIFVINAFTY